VFRRLFIFGLACFSLWVHFGAPFGGGVTQAASQEPQQYVTDGSALKVSPQKWVDPGWRILEKITTVRFDERGGWDATLEFSYKALTENGAKNLVEDKYNYDSSTESVTLDNVATVKADGRVLPVDPIAILDRTADPTLPEPFLDDKRVKVIVFPDVGPGDIVRGRVTWHVRPTEFAGRFASVYVHNFTQPIEDHRIIVDAPASLALQTKAVGAQETVERKGDRIIRTVVFPPSDPKPLANAADLFDVAPRYEVSTFTSWADVGAVIRDKNDRAAQPDAAVVAKAKELTAGVADRRERIKLLYDWVAKNIRYVAIETGFGGFESMTAHQTFVNRFGDCKAHVTLLKAMMAAIGEPADMVLVDIGPRYRQPSLPTPYFEHAILYAPSIDLYLDATSYQNPFGALPLPLADKPALDVEKGQIVRIPLATPADVKLAANTRLEYAADGTVKAHTVMTGEKSGDGMRRGAAEQLQQSNSRNDLSDMLRTFGFDGEGDFHFGDPRDLSAPLAITADYTFNLHADLDNLPEGIRLVTPVEWSAWMTWNMFNDRLGTATACAPMDLTDVVTATLPEGYAAPTLPPPRDYEEEAHGRTALGEVTGKIAYHISFAASGREITEKTHATFAFSHGLCDAHVVERAWRAAMDLNRYRWQAVQVKSPNVSQARLWLRSILVKAHQNLQ
jgi:transglutaminase-like putative cysteine protease